MEPPDLEVDFVHPGSVSLLYLVFLFDILRYEQILDLCDPRPFFRGKTGIMSHFQAPFQLRHWGSVQTGLLMVPLESIELGDYDAAWRNQRILSFAGKGVCQKHLDVALFRRRDPHVVVVSRGNDHLVNDFSSACDTLYRNAAAVSVSKEKAASGCELVGTGACCSGATQEAN
jgi:hypothetical protein